MYILHLQWALLNQKGYITKVAKPKKLRATKCPWSFHFCDSLASNQNENAQIWLLAERKHVPGDLHSRKLELQLSAINILLLLGSLQCIIKIWNRPCPVSSTMWKHNHSWTTTSIRLPMVMVGMIKSLMASLFSIQFKGKKAKITTNSETPKWDCIEAYSACLRLK